MIFTYDGPMRPFLLALRSQTIPPALMPFLYDIQPPVSFVDGCIVVEIHDLRRNPETRTRVVMRPAPLAISQTIDQMLDRNGVSTEDEHLSLGIESRILVRSCPLFTFCSHHSHLPLSLYNYIQWIVQSTKSNHEQCSPPVRHVRTTLHRNLNPRNSQCRPSTRPDRPNTTKPIRKRSTTLHNHPKRLVIRLRTYATSLTSRKPLFITINDIPT